MSIREELLSLLVCPQCCGDLDGLDIDLIDGIAACAACSAAYPVRGGIPILLPPDAGHTHDELDHAHGHKHGQARYFDRALAEEFEITRPHGAPDAYGRLLRDKFSRGIRRLPQLDGATVLDACCGSGMDAEMLAEAGARVIAADISEGCAIRAQKRAERFGLDYLVVVADVERLPLRDRNVDIAFVHDGLHHLAEPADGVCEMARVARRALSINEPADALATSVMVRFGFAQSLEDSGNRVARLRVDEVSRVLQSAGFTVDAYRYLMYYRHQPGLPMRLASHPAAFPAFRAVARAADALIGRWGNKLQLTARRAA